MTPSHFDPQRWFNLLVAGDQRAYQYFFDKYIRHLAKFAFELTGNQLEAEDIAAESLYKMWQARAMLESPGHVQGFCFATAKNMSIDYLRKKSWQQSQMANLPEAEDMAEALEMQARRWEEIYKKAESLPKECKRIFLLIAKDGLDPQTAANQLKISIKTVYSQIDKAKKILRIQVKQSPLLLALLALILTG